MNQHRIHPSASVDEEEPALVPEKRQGAVLDPGLPSLLDVCRCPKCNGPMTARNGKQGPYFHCLCFERPRTVLKFETGNDPNPACVKTVEKPGFDSVPSQGELLNMPG